MNTLKKFKHKVQRISLSKMDTNKPNFRHLMLQAPMLITVVKGSSFIIETINEKALEVWGKSYQEVINKPLFKVLPQFKDGLKKILDNTYSTGAPFIANEIPVQLKRNGKPDTAYFNSIYQPVRLAGTGWFSMPPTPSQR